MSTTTPYLQLTKPAPSQRNWAADMNANLDAIDAAIDQAMHVAHTGTVAWTEVLEKPTAFIPISHTHDASEITGVLSTDRIPDLTYLGYVNIAYLNGALTSKAGAGANNDITSINLGAGSYASPSLNIGTGASLFQNATNGLVFKGGSTNRMYWGTSGDLAIGASSAFRWSSTTDATATADLLLYREGGGILAQRNGTNKQSIYQYATYTDASNYERLCIDFGSGNDSRIYTAKAGTGAIRSLYLGTNATMRWYVDGNVGALVPVTDNAHDIGASGTNRVKNLFLVGTMSCDRTATANASNNYGSAIMQWQGSFWNGSAAVSDAWTMQSGMATGTNPAHNISLTKNGQSGSFIIYASTQVATPTQATSGANSTSPTFTITGRYWDGSASAIDNIAIQNVMGSGTNPSAFLTITHNGSPNVSTGVNIIGELRIGKASSGTTGRKQTIIVNYALGINETRQVTITLNANNNARGVGCLITGMIETSYRGVFQYALSGHTSLSLSVQRLAGSGQESVYIANPVATDANTITFDLVNTNATYSMQGTLEFEFYHDTEYPCMGVSVAGSGVTTTYAPTFVPELLPIGFPNGTVAQPSMTFSANSNRGFFSIPASGIGLVLGGVHRVLWQSTGAKTTSDYVLQWASSTTDPTVAGDTGISRGGVAEVRIGNGTSGDQSGSLRAASVYVNGIRWTSGTGTPEGAVAGNPGSLFSDSTNGDLYVKKTGTGNTGWVLK